MRPSRPPNSRSPLPVVNHVCFHCPDAATSGAGKGALDLSALRKMGLSEAESPNDEHAYRNARQSLILMDHALRSGLRRTFTAGVAQLADMEGTIRAYRPKPWEAEEHSETIHLIRKLRAEASRIALT